MNLISALTAVAMEATVNRTKLTDHAEDEPRYRWRSGRRQGREGRKRPS